jgi:hypothetical protein
VCAAGAWSPPSNRTRPFADTKTVKLYGQLEAGVYDTLKS